MLGGSGLRVLIICNCSSVGSPIQMFNTLLKSCISMSWTVQSLCNPTALCYVCDGHRGYVGDVSILYHEFTDEK